MVDDLLTRGGLLSMMDTVAIILCALSFGGIMEKSGMLHAISRTILKKVRSTGSLVLSTILSCTVMNLLASEQYMAIVIPGRMLKETYKAKGLHPKNLSRCLEDSGTLTSPLIPWNSCGAFMGATLGISPFLYLPYAFLNLLNPIISVFYGYTGITMEKLDADHASAVPSPSDEEE
jgi:NhaC family Na+:H+ antiporter